jgi:hypothetical protein
VEQECLRLFLAKPPGDECADLIVGLKFDPFY